MERQQVQHFHGVMGLKDGTTMKTVLGSMLFNFFIVIMTQIWNSQLNHNVLAPCFLNGTYTLIKVLQKVLLRLNVMTNWALWFNVNLNWNYQDKFGKETVITD